VDVGMETGAIFFTSGEDEKIKYGIIFAVDNYNFFYSFIKSIYIF